MTGRVRSAPFPGAGAEAGPGNVMSECRQHPAGTDAMLGYEPGVARSEAIAGFDSHPRRPRKDPS